MIYVSSSVAHSFTFLFGSFPNTQKTGNDVAFFSIVLYIAPFLKAVIQLEKLFWGAEKDMTYHQGIKHITKLCHPCMFSVYFHWVY